MGGARNWLSIGSSHTGDNSYSNMGIGGSYEQFSYGLRANTDHADNQSWSASGSGRGRYGDGSLGYSQGKNYRALHASWNGSLVAHEGGINLAPGFMDGFILAEVEDTESVGFAGQNAKTGNNGYAVLSTFTPYKRNWVKIDAKTLPDDVEIDGNDSQVVPRKGAITKVVFPARKVIRAQFELRSASGKILPFGTQLESKDGELLAMSDPHGRAMALLNKPAGVLVIKGDKMQCVVPYSLPSAPTAGQSYHQAVLQCSNSDDVNTDQNR